MNRLASLKLTIPKKYTPLELLDETVDSMNILCHENKHSGDISIRVFSIDEMKTDFITQIREWNTKIQKINAVNETNIKIVRTGMTSRFLYYDIQIVGDDLLAIRKFQPRNIDFLCFYGDDMYDDEKHAICIQLIVIRNQLINIDIVLPIFPSKILLDDDLFIQLADLYPPNPIDEEAYLMGWFNEDEELTNDKLFIKIFQLIWKLDSYEKAETVFNNYIRLLEEDPHDLPEFYPRWAKLFLKVHRKDSDLKGLPPIIRFDINRAALKDVGVYSWSYNITEIIAILPGLTQHMIQNRLIQLTVNLMDITNDSIQALTLLLVYKILQLTGISDPPTLLELDEKAPKRIDQDMLTKFIYSILSSNNMTSRLVLYCVLPKLLVFYENDFEFQKQIICASFYSSKNSEKIFFENNFGEMMNEINKTAIKQKVKPSSVKTFVCQLIDMLKTTDYLLGSLKKIPISLYNVDSVIAKMSSQVFTQIELRYLISIVGNASPSMLFKFHLMSALSSNCLCSLVLTYTKKLKNVVLPADYYALMPTEIQNGLIIPPTSPPLIDDTLLESIGPMVAKQVFDPSPPTEKVVRTGTTIPAIHIENGKTNDIVFDPSGNSIFTGSNVLRRYNLCDHQRKPDLNITMEKGTILSMAIHDDSIFIASSNQALYQYSFLTNSMSHITSFKNRISTISKVDEINQVFIALETGDIITKNKESVYQKLMTINSGLGIPHCICQIPNTPKYVIGTTSGTAILYDTRMQFPIRRIRATNFPANISQIDQFSFGITCGPFAAIFDSEMSRVIKGLSAPPSHVLSMCSYNKSIITAHSDYSMYSWNFDQQESVSNLGDISASTLWSNDGIYMNLKQSNVMPLHDSPISFLKPSPTSASVLSCSISGKILITPLPVVKK